MIIQEKNDDLLGDIETLIITSLQDTTAEDDEDVLDSLCKSIAKTDSCEELYLQAEQGDAEAALQVAGWHIANAQNILDYCKAYKYAKKAAKSGCVESYYILGQLALYGTGCSKNIPRAIKHLRYFVENVEERDLPNEAVLVDAYAKLGEAEEKQGNRRRAFEYYMEAQARDKRFDTQLGLLKADMADRQRGYFFAAVVVATAFLCLSSLLFLCSKYGTKDSMYARYFPWNSSSWKQTEQVQTIERD